jgi:hypothetical protein
VNQSVVVNRGPKVTKVKLSPRTCGVLSFDASPKGSQFVLTPLAQGDTARGTVPAERLLLPAGDYSRAITHARCSPYIDTLRVDGTPQKLPKRALICQ